ncbi:MAG: hypothetical protein HY731_01445, partial [Candidatus Tectomicrobia bacterium]|nr:hypothetical protein [Candidatus Tectomicrobia bacterium]
MMTNSLKDTSRMNSSMTGYGRGQAQIEETGCTVEVRTVN